MTESTDTPELPAQYDPTPALPSQLTNLLGLKDVATNVQIVDAVTRLTKVDERAAAAISADEIDRLRTANSQLAKALRTLSQVNRAQASMLEDVFVSRGAG